MKKKVSMIRFSTSPKRTLSVHRSHTMQLEVYLAESANALGMVECTTTSKTSELELKNMFYKTYFALVFEKTPVYIQKFTVKEVPLPSIISSV